MAHATTQQPSTEEPENPFTDLQDISVYSITEALQILDSPVPPPSTYPQEDVSLYSITKAPQNPASPIPSRSTDAGDALQGINSETGTAVRDSEPTRTRETLTAAPQSSISASTVPLHRTGATLVSSTHGHATTAPNGIANMNENPFADPTPRVQVQDEDGPSTPLPRTTPTPLPRTTPRHTPIQTNYLHPNSSSPQSSFGPTPPPKSPSRAFGSSRWNTFSSKANHIKVPPGLQSHASASASKSNTSLACEALARDSAQRQDLRLASERARFTSYSQADLQVPHLRPSPSAVRVAAELIRARNLNVAYGAQAIVKSPGFWIAVLGVLVGLISTSAAIAVIVEASRYGEKAHVGTGRVFWLVFSLVVFLVSAGVVLGLWLRKSGGAGFGGGGNGLLRRLGGDEVGLMDSVIWRDVELGRMPISTTNVPDRHMPSPTQSVRGSPRSSIPSAASLSSVRTRDPEWQAMYATPREIWQQVSQENLEDTPVRSGAFGIHKGSDNKRGDDGQRAHPTRKSSISTPGNLETPNKPWDQEVQPLQKPAPALTRSDKSWPLRSSPLAAPVIDTDAERSPYQTFSPASDYIILQNLTPRNRLSSNNPYNTPSPLPTSDPITIPTPTVTIGPRHHRAESRVKNHSPLLSLNQSIHGASQISPPHDRPNYIQAHRVASEERVQSLRDSLDSQGRGESITSDSTHDQDDESVASTNPLFHRRYENLQEFLAGSEVEYEAKLAAEREAQVVEPGNGVGGIEWEQVDDRRGRRRSRSVMGLADGYGGKTHQQRAKDVLAGVKSRLHQRQNQTRGRSLGSVVRAKMAKLKEAGVEPDPEPTPPMPQMPSPIRTRPNLNTNPDANTNSITKSITNNDTELSIPANDPPAPTATRPTPSKIPRKPTPHPVLSTSSAKSLLQTPNKETSILSSSPLSREEGYERLDD